MVILLACEQALRGGREKEGELVTTSLEFEFHLQFPCGSLSTELSDFRQSARSRNKRECKQTRAKGNDVITNVISAYQRFASDIQIPETKLQVLLPFPALPTERPGELARRLVFFLIVLP